MRKFVNVVALFVLVATNVFTPFSYAQYNTSGDINNTVQENEQVLDNVEDDVTLGEQGNENIRENNIDSIVDALEGTGDDNQSSGSVISEEEVNLIESEENNDLEDSSFFGGFKETLKDLFGEENEEFNEDENIEKEIESKEIYGTGEYEGVKVEVYAQTGLFDNGTKLTIEPVVEEKLEAVQEVLLSSGNIELVEEDENKTVIAFDITFRDSVTDEEVQPKNGVVQVAFNYEENESLVQADENEEQEVKVYHLNDIDEEGNKIEELTGTVVEDVIINEEESEEDNVMVIEAESFSVYTIVVQVREEGVNAITENQLANFVYGEISIARPAGYVGEGPAGFTIMDRNLGAINNDIASTGSYGYHYQWGNNYGFDSNLSEDLLPKTENKVDLVEGQIEYFGREFIWGPSNSVWTNNYNALWGGEGGQGPCPEGWHVPTASQWVQLMRYYVGDDSVNTINDEAIISGFFSMFKLPRVGYRDYYNARVGKNFNMYRSSSNHWGSNYYVLTTEGGMNASGYHEISWGLSVRCFKNTYSGTGNIFTITYDFNGGSGSTAAINVLLGGIVERPTDPIKSGYVFGGRFVQGTDTEYDFTEKVTGNVDLYAKWETFSVLLPGEEFHSKIVGMAGNGSNIIKIKRSSHLPSSIVGNSEYYVSTSDIPVYAWYDDGIIYYYSEAKEIYMNESAYMMFSSLSNLNEIEFSGMNANSVIDMRYMFAGDSSLRYVDLSSLRTSSNLTNMQGMFTHAGVTGVNFNNFDTSNVTDMSYMFDSNTYLQSLDLSSFSTENLVTASCMFINCSSLETLNLSSFNTTNLNNISGMFNGCSSLKSLDLHNFDTSNLSSISTTFQSCSNLEYLNIDGWDLRNLANAGNSTIGWRSWISGIGSSTSLGTVISFKNGKIPNNFTMQSSSGKIRSIDVSNLDLTGVSSVSSMFAYNYSLENINGINTWKNTENITEMEYLFAYDELLPSIDMSNLDLKSVNKISSIFQNNFNLKTINLSGTIFGDDLDTKNIFSSLSNLKTIYATQPFREGIDSVFYGAISLVGGNGTKYNTSNSIYSSSAYAKIDDENGTGYFTNPNHFAVRFKTLSGTEIETQWISVGKTATGINDPSKIYSYYTSPDMQTGFDFNEPLYAYTEVYVMGKNVPTVTFDLYGGYWTEEGTGSILTKTKTFYEDEQGSLTDRRTPSKEPIGQTGWMFDGWYLGTGSASKKWTGYVTNDMIVYAKWLPFEDLPVTSNGITFTIMDRNIGAISNGTGSNSYGYHFQWGNNYGFKPYENYSAYFPNGEIGVDIVETNISNHVSTYYNGLWRNMNPWNDSSIDYGNNLWGGENELNEDSLKQGPCPSGYHVPVRKELNMIKKLLPYAGDRTYQNQNKVVGMGFNGFYWTSLPDGANEALQVNFSSSNTSFHLRDTRSFGFSVRCFKNTSSKSLVYELNGGINNDNNPTYSVRRWETGTPLQTPLNSDTTMQFQGWFTTSGFDEGSQVTTNAISTDDKGGLLKLYAKWERNCGEGKEYVESEDKCYPSRAIIRDSLTNEIIQINDQEWKDLELYILTGNGTLSHYTIMDRNMGASGVYNGNYKNPNSDSFGYYYQWGNNYGFSCGSLGCDEDHIGSSSVSTSQVEKNKWSSYIPSRWASNVFIYKTSWQKNPGIGDGLWGGTGDSLDANGNNTTPEGRQGPCPDGYHIPSTSEWNQMYQLWSGGVINSSSPILLAKNFLLPSAGQITLFEGYALGLGYLGRLAGCWSSSAPDSAYASMFDLYDGDSRGWDESEITPQESYSRGFGLPIRCSKNQSNSNSLTLHMGNANTKAVIGVLSGNNKLTVNSIESSISNGYVKWYGNENLDPSTEIVTGSDLTSIHDLYVSYNCNEGYAFSGSNELGGECVKQLTVTFNGNGGNITTGSIIVLSGSELDLSKYTATKPGWNFTGWNINSGAHEGLNNLLTVNSNITLYAIYTKEYTSNFVLKDSNAATLNGTTASCMAYNTGYCTVTPPTLSAKNGYSVDGWSETNGGTETTSIFTGGITYYSVTHYNTPISVTFYQNGNGGNGSEVRTCYKYNGSQTCKIRSPMITLENGSSAIGWNTSPNYHSSSWNQNVERDVSYNELYYAQTQKLLTATFKSNDNKNYIDGNITDRTRTCYIYNNSTAGCTETTPKIQPRGENTPTVVGFTKSKEGVSTAEVGSNSTVRIYGGEVYYAHTKREKVDLIANWNGNNSTLGDTTLSEGCELPEVYDGAAQPTSCEVDAPSVTPSTNTPIFVGFNTGANATTNNSSYNSGTNKLILTKNNSNSTWYAITYMSGKVLTIDYSIGIGVYSIGRNSDSCTLTGTYNGVAQSSSCTVNAPSITVSSGYLDNSKKWTDLSTSNEVEEGELITLTKDLHYTASAQYKSSAQPETYTITYELNGGIISGEKLVYTVEDDTFTLVRPTREHHKFVGWTGSNGLTPKLDVVIEHGIKYENLTYYANWYEDFNDNGINDATEDHFVVKYTDGVDGENVFEDQVFSGVLIGLATPSFIGTPSRNGYDFVGWEPNVSEFVLADIEYVAKWDKKSSGGGNSSGGGGKRFPTVDIHGSADEEKTGIIIDDIEENVDSQNVDNEENKTRDENKVSGENIQNNEEKVEETDHTSQYSEDFNQAYQFSKANGITTIDEIQNAKMYGNLTRIEMAKMLSNYAVNVIGRQPDVSKIIKFKDVSSKLDKQYDNGVTLAYQLGIMGQNMKNKKFRPNDKVTRAEFATALSRLLYKTPEGTNKGTKKYYEPHIAKLYNEGIITNTNPNMKEKRGYVMIMLMRSAGIK